MKQPIQPDADVAQKTVAGSARSWHPQQQAAAHGGHLVQLSAMMNSSPGSKALTQLKEDMQHGPQGLMGLAAEINQSAPAQLRGVPVNDDAGLEHEADVMGAKALAIQHQPASGNAKVHNNPVQQGTDAPVQRVRILLRDEDQDLMARLRLVPVANVGAQTLQDPAQVGTLNEIGLNESIVLEGHGYIETPFLGGAPRAVSQGGIPPARLAAVAHGVPKPDAWAGNIVLLGCSTGDIIAAVSQEYFKLARKAVKVIGTRASIRVGTKEDGSVFIGHDWSEQPVDQRPADLAFVEELREANRIFSAAIKKLLAICRALSLNANGTPTAIPYPADQIEAQGVHIIDIESTSAHKGTAVDGRRYAKPARIKLSVLFQGVFAEISKITFFESPSTVRPIASVPTAKAQVGSALVAMKKLVDDGDPLREEVEYELLGYTLKEVNLDSNVSAKHSKRRRTKESFFGDTWVDEA
jgi:hypothetical protein